MTTNLSPRKAGLMVAAGLLLAAIISTFSFPEGNGDKGNATSFDWLSVNPWTIFLIVLGAVLAWKKIDVGKTIVAVGAFLLIGQIFLVPWLGEENVNNAGKHLGCSISGGQDQACQDLGRAALGLDPMPLPIIWHGQASGQSYPLTSGARHRFPWPDGQCVMLVGGSNIQSSKNNGGNYVDFWTPDEETQAVTINTVPVGVTWKNTTCEY